MKKTAFYIKSLLLLVFLFLPYKVFATDTTETESTSLTLKDTEVNYVKEQNGKYCIDLESAYADSVNTSKALTGLKNSIDATKRTTTLSAVVNIYSLLAGNQIFCIKDEVAAAATNTHSNTGIVDLINKTNTTMLVSFPTVNIPRHLAETFVPGVSSTTSTMASENCANVYNFCGYACEYDNTDNCIQTCTYDCEPYWSAYNQYHNLKEGSRVDAVYGAREDNRNVWDKLGDFLSSMLNPVSEKAVDDYVTKGVENVDADGIQTEVQSHIANEEGPEYESGGYRYLVEMGLSKMWGKFRDIAYIFFVLMVIVIGFMIMFRHKLGGQMMVTVANSIPNVIVGLVLVTFSFAIAGFMLDIGKFGMALSASIFADEDVVKIEGVTGMTDRLLRTANEDTGVVTGIVKKFSGRGWSDSLWKKIAKQNDGLAGQASSIFLGGVFNVILTAFLDMDLSPAGGGLGIPVEAIIDPILSVARLGITIFLIKQIIVLLVCAYAAIKLLLTMLVTYLKIFISVVLAPLQILVGSLPGNFSYTINWFKSLLANVLVFVAIFIIINFSVYFASNIGDTKNLNFFGNSGVLWPSVLINLKGVILIAGYLFASNIPGVINGFLKVGSSKEMSVAAEATKKTASKLPVIGGIFN